jgi:AAA+ superfamily predicted ATPase
MGRSHIQGAAGPVAASTGAPDTGDFYRYPSQKTLERTSPGEILASEPMTVSSGLQNTSSHAMRIMYRSVGLHGEPIAVTGFLLLPRGDTPRGGWPVTAWGHGTTGVGPACAPSRQANLYPYSDSDQYPEAPQSVVRKQDGQVVPAADTLPDVDPTLIDSLRAAVADRPDDIPLRVHLAELLLAAQSRDEAIGHLARALASDPHDVGVRALMARAIAGGDPASVGEAEPSPTRPAVSSETAQSKPAAPTGPTASPADADWSAIVEDLDGVIPPRFLHSDDEPDPIRGDSDGIVQAEVSAVRLTDVGGMDDVKARLELAFLAPMRNPKLRALYGKKLRGGLLMYGPPGCGKTFLARAVAGEMGARFISVSIVDVLDMWSGQSERNLHEIFQAARRNAPCVLFFDEIDALGHKRSQLGSSVMRTLGNQLLVELDGVETTNEGVFVLAATNAPWDVDAALRRPGRLDRMLFVAPPDAPARAAILQYHLQDRPIANIDLTKLAAATEAFSGADLEHLCETAAEHAIQSAITSGEVRMIEQRDLEAAARPLRPSTGAWFASAKNVAQFGNQDGSYDDLAQYLKRHPVTR